MEDLIAARSYPAARSPIRFLQNSTTVWCGQGTPVFVVENPSKGTKRSGRSSSSVKILGDRKPLGSLKARTMLPEQHKLLKATTTIGGNPSAEQVGCTSAQAPSTSKHLRLFFSHNDAKRARRDAGAPQGLFGCNVKIAALSLEALFNEFETNPEKYGNKTIEFVRSQQGIVDGVALQTGRSSDSRTKILCGTDLSCVRRWVLSARKFVSELTADWRVLFGIEMPLG
eukprot:GHVS01103679.1.p1 GENE.GHVS01103679.1~~GHVS01103679.1.p1  ORF type:complete len:235 (-),score=6.34 GHVS01103679.1:27-707(-)